MPNGKEFFSAISVMKILTLVLTNSLGNYKCTYLKSMDMDGRTFVKKFVYIWGFFHYTIMLLHNHTYGIRLLKFYIFIILIIFVVFSKTWKSSKKKYMKETPPLLKATIKTKSRNTRMNGYFQTEF